MPRKFIWRGIRPRINLFRDASHSAEYILKGLEHPRKLVKRGLIPNRKLFRGVRYPAKFDVCTYLLHFSHLKGCLEGYDITQKCL
jgi:hypothetical protein